MMQKQLRHIPNATIIEHPEMLETYRGDESHIAGELPVATVKPRRPDALRELVRIAKGEGFTLIPRGTGTGKAGGAVPFGKSLVIDMSDYLGDINISLAELALRAPASALLKNVKVAAAERGLFYPPDPNSWDQCSFGGSLATNAGGPCAGKYGMTRQWVLSVDALMEDGEIHHFGIDTVKDNAGPSLGQLLIGSEGIFGIITGASVRLLPAPKERLTILLPVARWGDLLELPVTLVENGLLPCAFEFWDPAVLSCLREFGPEAARGLPGEALALLEFDDAGCTGEAFLSNLSDVLGPMSEHVQVATESHRREDLWGIRRQTSTVLKERFTCKVSEDISVPRSKIAAFFEGAEKQKLPIVAYGHLGDGNIHVNLLVTNNTDALKNNIMALFRLALDLGGTLTGEHGIGLAKRDAFLSLTCPWRIQAIRGIKRALDPSGIFNMGKVV